MLTSRVASPSRWPRAASAMAQAAISGNAMIRTGVSKAERPRKSSPCRTTEGMKFSQCHEHERAKRHDRVTQPADGGQRQRRQRQHGMARNVRLDDRAADAGAGNFRHVAEQHRRMREPVEGFDGGDDDQKQIKPEQPRRADGTGAASGNVVAEFITIAIGWAGISEPSFVWGGPGRVQT